MFSFCQHWSTLGPNCPEFHRGKFRPNLAEIRPSRPSLAKIWPDSANNWPISTRRGRLLTNFGRVCPDFGQHWPNVGPLWPIQARSGRTWATSQRGGQPLGAAFGATFGQVRSSPGSLRVTSTDVSAVGRSGVSCPDSGVLFRGDVALVLLSASGRPSGFSPPHTSPLLYLAGRTADSLALEPFAGPVGHSTAPEMVAAAANDDAVAWCPPTSENSLLIWADNVFLLASDPGVVQRRITDIQEKFASTLARTLSSLWRVRPPTRRRLFGWATPVPHSAGGTLCAS